jgi:CheY-like chemotaxis protein
LVFLDIGMPVMSGLQAAERIRSAAWGREITLVALSGWGQEGDREKSRQAGVDEHLLKPVDIGAIQRILAEVRRAGAGPAH